MSLLEVRNLTKKFGGLIAVNNLCCDVKEGEILGLIGPNGAGKSTVFKMITGFLKPDAGRVRFNGEDITGLPPDRICRKGVVQVFQLVNPFPKLSVLQNAMVGAYCRKTGKEVLSTAKNALDLVGLSNKARVRAESLTLPEIKSLQLARALATEPKILLLDEIAAGLNPAEVSQTMQLIEKIRDAGITIVLVEHVMKVVMGISDRIVVLHAGVKIAEGPPGKVAHDSGVIKAYLGEEYVF